MQTKKNFRYKETKSKTGKLQVDINQELTKRITTYCKNNNLNKSKFVEECVDRNLSRLEKEYYSNLSKEELINILLNK